MIEIALITVLFLIVYLCLFALTADLIRQGKEKR